MRKFVVLGRPGCSYCDKAMSLLDEKGESFAYFNVREHTSFLGFMTASGMPMTVPQVFLNGHLIGGYEQLSDLINGWAVIG